MARIDDVRAAYDLATGRWTGCQWPARYGALRLNVTNMASTKAASTAERWRRVASSRAWEVRISQAGEKTLVRAAQALGLRGAVALIDDGGACRLSVWGPGARRGCAGFLSEEWAFASCWLREIEWDAYWAEAEAWEAVRTAEAGDWVGALRHADRACFIEAGYDARLPWWHLRRALGQAGD